jgi:hypothetical protein
MSRKNRCWGSGRVSVFSYPVVRPLNKVHEVTSSWRCLVCLVCPSFLSHVCLVCPSFRSHVCFPKLPNLFCFRLLLYVFTWHCGRLVFVILVHLDLFPEKANDYITNFDLFSAFSELFVITSHRWNAFRVALFCIPAHQDPEGTLLRSGVPKWGLGGSTPLPPRNPEFFYNAEPNSQFRGKYIRNNLIRIRVSLICKFSGTPD